MFNEIIKIRPYFFSVREIEKNVSLDVKVPTTWKFETIITQYGHLKHKIQDKNDKFLLVSIICEATFEGYASVFECANQIITINKEFEEKQLLLKTKMRDLELLFQEETLNKLKNIKFILDERQENSEGIELDGEGNQER
jgi:hypothetical protein